MSYRIEVKKSAAKSLRKMPKADQKRIADKIDSLAENTPNPDTTKMKGNNPSCYHIPGNNRFRFLANSGYPSILKSIFSSITIRRMIAGAKINRNTHMVTQLKK